MDYYILATYIITNALAPVILKFVSSDVPHSLMIFLSTLFAIIFFHILNFGKNITAYSKLFNNRQILSKYFMLSIVIMLIWICGFIIPIQYSPFTFIFAYLGWPTFWGAFSLIKKNTKFGYKISFALVTFTLILFYGDLYFQGYTTTKYIWGIFITFSVGSLLYVYFKISAKINTLGFGALEIMVTRYWFLFLIPLIYAVYTNQIHLINLTIILKALLQSIILLIIPSYCMQISVKRLGSQTTAIYMGLTPFINIIFQGIILKTEVMTNIIISLALFLAIVIPHFILKQSNK